MPPPTGSEAEASIPIHTNESDGPHVRPVALATERVEACPLCGSPETKAWRKGCRDWQQPYAPDRFDYARCTRCGACFLTSRPLESELVKVYFAGYGPYDTGPAVRPDGPRTHPVDRALALPLRAAGALVQLPSRLPRQLDHTYTPQVEGEQLLDYGCGAPTFLDRAHERGFTTVGVDFAEEVVQAVRLSGHQAFSADEGLEGIPDDSVGCVRMNHVIEHLYHPHKSLAAIHKKMQPGGRIHIATPNPFSIGSRLFRRRWYALDCPRHVILYQPSVLLRLLHELGFSRVSVVHEVGSKDLVRSWGVVLYERGLIAHEQIAELLTDRTRLGLLLPFASLAALFGAADRYHVFAQRA